MGKIQKWSKFNTLNEQISNLDDVFYGKNRKEALKMLDEINETEELEELGSISMFFDDVYMSMTGTEDEILTQIKIDAKNHIDIEYTEELKESSQIESTIKIALENMYMFGGMPKPDPTYDTYLNNMIKTIMNAIDNEYKNK